MAQEMAYRAARSLPLELYEHCVILLEEKMCMFLSFFFQDAVVVSDDANAKVPVAKQRLVRRKRCGEE